MPYRSNPRSTEPLSPDEWVQWTSGIRDLPTEIYHRLALLTYTGMHPRVLEVPRAWDLGVTPMRIRWIRPKTGRRMDLRRYGDLAVEQGGGWLTPEWISALPSARSQAYSEEVALGATSMGISGRITPRTIRHSFVWYLVDLGLSPLDVATMAGCTMEIAYLTYARYGRAGADEQAAAGFRRLAPPGG